MSTGKLLRLSFSTCSMSLLSCAICMAATAIKLIIPKSAEMATILRSGENATQSPSNTLLTHLQNHEVHISPVAYDMQATYTRSAPNWSNKTPSFKAVLRHRRKVSVAQPSWSMTSLTTQDKLDISLSRASGHFSRAKVACGEAVVQTC